MVEVKNYNAKGDGVTNDTRAVQAALDSGEVVHFTPGTYLCGTLYMRSNGGICLDEGATLLAIPGKEHYNADDFSPRNRVFVSEKVSGAHFIIAEDCENISITGKGKIAGNYRSVFDTSALDNKWRPHYSRPEWRMAQMIFLLGCRNVKISGVTMCDSQYWTCFLLDCENVEISGIRIRCDRYVINADGLDIDCCRNVKISDCDIDCGDDCIAIRANERHAQRIAPCEKVTVENCLLRSPACAVRIGVGNGTLRDCSLRGLEIHDSAIGVGLCPSYSQGSCVNIENILFEDVVFEGKQAFMMLPLWGAVLPEDDPEIKAVRNITLRNFKGKCTQSSLVVSPIAKEKFSGIKFENVFIELQGEAEALSAYRWPFTENGVLNVFRMPELDTAGFHGVSSSGLPEVLHRDQ